MPIIGSLAGASAKGLGGLGASLILVPTTLTVDYLVVAGGGGGGGCTAAVVVLVVLRSTVTALVVGFFRICFSFRLILLTQ
jgi:hypothetical protein